MIKLTYLMTNHLGENIIEKDRNVKPMKVRKKPSTALVATQQSVLNVLSMEPISVMRFKPSRKLEIKLEKFMDKFYQKHKDAQICSQCRQKNSIN